MSCARWLLYAASLGMTPLLWSDGQRAFALAQALVVGTAAAVRLRGHVRKGA